MVAGERQAIDSDNAEKWIEDLWHEVTLKYEPYNIFNMGKTASFSQMLPSRTLALKSVRCHGGKLNKVCAAVFLMANMDCSSKLHPLVIGKIKSAKVSHSTSTQTAKPG